MTEPERPDPLAALGERLERARRARESGRRAVDRASDQSSRAAMGLGFRIGLELVVAVFVGVALGWAIDRWLGTRPWGMIVLFFLGVAAGMTNVYRAVNRISGAAGYPRRGAGVGTNKWDDEDS